MPPKRGDAAGCAGGCSATPFADLAQIRGKDFVDSRRFEDWGCTPLAALSRWTVDADLPVTLSKFKLRYHCTIQRSGRVRCRIL